MPTLIDQQLRDYIRTSGLSLYRVSQLSGVSSPVIQRFFNGERSLQLTTAAKLAHALGLRLEKSKKKA